MIAQIVGKQESENIDMFAMYIWDSTDITQTSMPVFDRFSIFLFVFFGFLCCDVINVSTQKYTHTHTHTPNIIIPKKKGESGHCVSRQLLGTWICRRAIS